MLKAFVYWVYLNRVFSGIISGRDHFLHGYGLVWIASLPVFSVLEYWCLWVTDSGFPLPLHYLYAGLFAFVVVIAALKVELKRDWTSDFRDASSIPLKTRAVMAGGASLFGLAVYLGTIIWLWDGLRSQHLD